MPIYRDKGSAQDSAVKKGKGREGGNLYLYTNTSEGSTAQEQCGVHWEVMIKSPMIPESKKYATTEIQDLQGKLDSINQVIQNAIQHKIMIENQVKDLMNHMTQQNS